MMEEEPGRRSSEAAAHLYGNVGRGGEGLVMKDQRTLPLALCVGVHPLS